MGLNLASQIHYTSRAEKIGLGIGGGVYSISNDV